MAEPNYDYDEGDLIDPDDPEANKATLVEHLDELRARILRSISIVVAGWVAGWFVQDPVFQYLEGILKDPSVVPTGVRPPEFVFTDVTQPFFLKLKLSFIIGLIAAGPFVIWQLWGFVRPALKKNERKALRKVVPFSVFLFLFGVCGAFVILKPAVRWFMGFLLDFAGASLLQTPGAFTSFVLKMILAFGIGFQLPVIVWFLARIGLLTSEVLWKQWRIALVAIIVFVMMLTPGGDVFSNVMLGVPLLLMYFITIIVIGIGEKKRRARGDEYKFD